MVLLTRFAVLWIAIGGAAAAAGLALAVRPRGCGGGGLEALIEATREKPDSNVTDMSEWEREMRTR
jgi:hypothetical protein